MRVAICDDQTLMCKEVVKHVNEYALRRECIIETKVFTKGMELLSTVQEFDIVFLDIELKNENGVEIAEQYRQNHDSKVIFLTSHIEEMPNGYKVRAFRFLLKPIDTKLFEEALDSAIDEINAERKLKVQAEDRVIIISTRDIIYVEAGDRSSCVRTEDGFYRSSMKLNEMWGFLGGREFYMPHRSYIINMNYIREIERRKIILRNGEKIEISKLKISQFNNYFHEYLRGKMNGRK